MNAFRRVSLPGGERVEISNIECPWWSTPHSDGFVSPGQCTPDPDQPRRHMTATGLASLRKSVKRSGVREPLTVTPRHLAPWVKLPAESANAYFVIVSGQRRWISAVRAELRAIPIRVRIYESAKDHYLDASLLNSNREDLAPLEWGADILRLQDVGWSMPELSGHYGKSLPYLHMRVHLTRLAPDIQKRLDPKLQDKKRLHIVVGGALGLLSSPTAEELEEVLAAFGDDARPEDGSEVLFSELDEDGRRFELQRMYLRVILKRHLSASQARSFVRKNTRLLRIGQSLRSKRSSKLSPARRRTILNAYLDRVGESAVNDWRPAHFREMLDGMPDDEVELLLERFRLARQNFDGLEALVQESRPPVAV